MATDDNGVPWQDQQRLDESIATHQEQFKGRARYLQEVSDAFKAIQGHDFGQNPALNVQNDRGSEVITYKGLDENKNYLYLIHVGDNHTDRIMIITEDQRVMHYAKKEWLEVISDNDKD